MALWLIGQGDLCLSPSYSGPKKQTVLGVKN